MTQVRLLASYALVVGGLAFGVACRDGDSLDSLRNLPEGNLIAPGSAKSHPDEARDPANGVPEVYRYYRSSLTRRQVLDFYANELAARGWSIAIHESPTGMSWENETYFLGVSFGGRRLEPDEVASEYIVHVEELE